MNRDIVPFNLDDLTGVAGQITLKGKTHDVLPLNGLAYHTVQRLTQTPAAEADTGELWGVVKQLCPSMSQEEIDQLTAAQVHKIIEISSTAIVNVEKRNPKSPRPRTGRRG